MRGCFGTDLVILNRLQMTRTAPDLAPASPNFRTAAPAYLGLYHPRFLLTELAPENRTVLFIFLLSRIRSIQRESIVIVKRFELEILTNLHVLDLPESEKDNFGIMSVCLSMNTITRKLLELQA
ncbi:hypothetical protein AVEN_36310-1 [Araneus ventricosus]|uniref:Uncharacterized protein n=1 Tax=Araneus ventricosus TaxID=182803 RepID=A0A4Y2QXB0_ARAVE|nr:hypothetical protein AVEN_36310-1 [Araneus ventricosus]